MGAARASKIPQLGGNAPSWLRGWFRFALLGSILVKTGAKLKRVVNGVHYPKFAEKQTSFESNLPTNRTFLEFYQQYNVDQDY